MSQKTNIKNYINFRFPTYIYLDWNFNFYQCIVGILKKSEKVRRHQQLKNRCNKKNISRK